ncbi:hypothetical protein B447_02441 [Thauera sp. 27]|uniref:hypothetical protein n=1 Tax=Thauera sp. 27 TaxID=305700 RepID=UPI0002CEB9EE|nr:hypothetical protein [Thauera sp. 27]ENO82839.1 hypothetical protein B447_02441 [Thauera sp. 27]
MNTKTQNALRAALQHEDSALEKRLPEPAQTEAAATTQPPVADVQEASSTAAPEPVAAPAGAQNGTADTTAANSTPVATAAAGAEPPAAPAASAQAPAEPVAADKPQRETFVIGENDCKRLKVLRADLADSGKRPGKSELVRAAIGALAAQGTDAVRALLRALAPLGTGKKAKAAEKKKDESKRKKTAAKKAGGRKEATAKRKTNKKKR